MQRQDITKDPLKLALLVVACIAIATGVYSRFATIAEIGMWYDELHSVVRLSNTALPRAEFLQSISNDPSPPLYYLFLYEIKKLGAESETHMRLIQNFLFFLTILLLWTRLNPVTALVRTVQSAFLVGSYGLIYYSTELRSYSLMILLTIPQSLLFLRIVFALEEGPSIPHRWLISFVIVSVALTIVHYLGAVAVGTSFALLAGFLAANGRIRGLAVVIAYGLVTCLPVVGWFVASHDFGASTHPVGLISDPIFLARQVDRFMRLVSGNIVAALLLSVLIAGALWAVLRGLLLQGARAPDELKAAAWLGALAAATWLAAYAVTILILPIVSMRNLLVTAPAIYLALGYVIAFWLRSNERIAQAGIAMTILYFLSSGSSNFTAHDPLKLNTKKDWVASAERINELKECAAQPIIVVGHPVGFYRYYIDSSKGIELVGVGTPGWTARPGDGEMQQWVELLDGEVAQAREVARSSSCGVKMWYVPTGFVSEEHALGLGAQIFEADHFKLERVGNAFLFRG